MSDNNDKPIKGLWNAAKTSVLYYEDPFAPAIDPSEWEVIREASGLPLRESYVVAGPSTNSVSGSVPASVKPSAKP
jgi:hypothetical protein